MSSQLAYLGPQGSYSHKAAKIIVQSLTDVDEEDLIPQPTLTAVYHSPTRYALLPLENTIQGPVMETLDCILSFPIPSSSSNILSEDRHGRWQKGRDWTIIRDLDLKIDHCLAVKKGTQLNEVRWVISHEQALGQCSTYLSTHLPSAKRIPVASTALAATLLSNSQSSPSQYPTHLSQNVLSAKNNVPPVHEDGVVNGDLSTKPLDGVGAAICSKEIVMELEGLEIVEEGVQNVKDNYTRFILLSRPTPDPNPSLLTPTSTSQPSSTPPSSFFILDDPSHIDSIPKSNTVKSIISRPFPKQGQKYAKRYLVEIEGSAGEDVGTDDASEGFGRRPGVMYLGSV